MPTNLAIDDKLLQKAVELGKHKTKKAAVEEALTEYVRRREQLKILDAFGTFDFHPDYDYKKLRNRR